MANLMQFAPAFNPTPPPAWTQGQNATQGGLANVGAGLGMSRLERNYTTRALPDLVSSQAAQGSFFSGATNEKAKRIGEDVSDQGLDIQYKLATTLSDLAKSGVLAQIGVGL